MNENDIFYEIAKKKEGGMKWFYPISKLEV
jgi:hypothetical protein